MGLSIIPAHEINQWRTWAKAQAIAADISVSEVDWFLQALTAVNPLDLRLGITQSVSSSQSLDNLFKLWEKRVKERIPVQYLVGKAPWRNFELLVTPDVLIPRPETEYLIDLAKERSPLAPLPKRGSFSGEVDHWVDLGTGSGAIALGLAESFPEATIHAVDQSPQALIVARQNAQTYGFCEQIQFYQGSWWEPLTHLKGKAMGMISNPPYIPSQMLPDLQPEVYRHEPHTALDGGTDGLDDIRVLIAAAPDYLVAGGIWLIEMMLGQGQAVAQLLTENGHYENIQIIYDFAGGDRYVLATRK